MLKDPLLMTSAPLDAQRALLVDWRQGEALPQTRARTLAGLVALAIERHGERVVLVEGDRRWSWQDLDRASGALAARWADVLRPGERVAILASNGAAHLVAELCRLAAGVRRRPGLNRAGGPPACGQRWRGFDPRIVVLA